MLIHLAKIAPSGRMYYRHPSGMGSVMMYYDDPELKYLKRVLVLDAQYRSNQRFGALGVDSGNKYIHINLNNSYCRNIFDRYLINNLPRDPQSSRENCDNLMKLNSVKDEWFEKLGYVGVPAVNYCRNIIVNGVSCDLPNINILTRILFDRETIDDLDPTISEYPKYALSKKYNLQGDWTIGEEGSSGSTQAAINTTAWSSTEYSSSRCLNVGDDNRFYCDGKYCEFSVIPVLEL